MTFEHIKYEAIHAVKNQGATDTILLGDVAVVSTRLTSAVTAVHECRMTVGSVSYLVLVRTVVTYSDPVALD